MKHPTSPPSCFTASISISRENRHFFPRDPSPMGAVGVRTLHTGTLRSPHPSRCELRSPMEANGDPIHVSEISRRRSWGGGGDARQSTRAIFLNLLSFFFFNPLAKRRVLAKITEAMLMTRRDG